VQYSANKQELGTNKEPHTMSAEKRAASGSFSSSQMVKRQKSDANLNGSALTVVNGSARDGAIIKAVCLPSRCLSRFSMVLNVHGRTTLADSLGG
jgi:Prp8 binding protein